MSKSPSLAGDLEIREIANDLVAYLLAPKPVHRRVRDDPLEQQRQFGGRPVEVFLRQADHRVLHDVEGCVFVPDGVHGALPGTLFDAFQKVGKFFVGRQGKASPGLRIEAGRLSIAPRGASWPRRIGFGGCDNSTVARQFRSPAGPESEAAPGDRPRHRTRLTRAWKGAPMVFRQRNSQRFENHAHLST